MAGYPARRGYIFAVCSHRIFVLIPNLDIIYDVTTEVTWDERKTNKQVIYQTTSLPSFVTFDAFYFCLWPKTLSFERYLGGKALATDHRVFKNEETFSCNSIFTVLIPE